MSKRTRNKATQVQKVAAETKVDPKDLDRLPQDALQKLDDMTPDDDFLGGEETMPSAEISFPELPSSESQSNDVVGDETNTGTSDTGVHSSSRGKPPVQEVSRDGQEGEGVDEESDTSELPSNSETTGEETGSKTPVVAGSDVPLEIEPELPNPPSTVPAEDVVLDDTTPDYHNGAISGIVSGCIPDEVIGEHPVTGETVRVCDQ